jgi:hypothetical protein
VASAPDRAPWISSDAELNRGKLISHSIGARAGLRSLRERDGREMTGVESNSRRFNMLDALVLIVPTALCTYWIKFCLPELLRAFADSYRSPGPFYYTRLVTEVLGCVGGVLAFFTPTLLLLRLRRPRAPRLRLMRQPGITALASASVIILVAGICIAATWIFSRSSIAVAAGLIPVYSLVWLVGGAVFAAWSITWLSGRWRSEATWIDRAGRVSGVLWIAIFIISTANSAWLQTAIILQTAPPLPSAPPPTFIPGVPPPATVMPPPPILQAPGEQAPRDLEEAYQRLRVQYEAMQKDIDARLTRIRADKEASRKKVDPSKAQHK